MRVIDDEQLAILNAWMEARGESDEGLQAVCEVMRNRAKGKKWGRNLTEVILAPYQFSGWNTSDPNRTKALQLDKEDGGYQRARVAWEKSATSNLAKGAQFYFNPKVVAKPKWAEVFEHVATVGNHEFYKEHR